MSDDRYRIGRNAMLTLIAVLSGAFKGVKMPRDFSGTFEAVDVPNDMYGDNAQPIPGGPYTVKVIPTPAKGGKSSAHRVFLVCPTCGRDIPTGRFHQHRSACFDPNMVPTHAEYLADRRATLKAWNEGANARTAAIAHHTGDYEGM